jgi:hypothetical protein
MSLRLSYEHLGLQLPDPVEPNALGPAGADEAPLPPGCDDDDVAPDELELLVGTLDELLVDGTLGE